MARSIFDTRLGVVALALILGACRSTPVEPEPTPARAVTPVTETAPAPLPSTGPANASSSSGFSSYDVPQRTDAELRATATAACREAQATRRPLLLDVGADWCGDCRALYRLEREAPLADELGHYRVLSVNLGDELHGWLRQAFGIKAIARWLVLRPLDCSAPLESWPVVDSRVVEPKTGEFNGPSELVDWLRQARKKF
ncbi:MAG TPA: thioredoxin family protein [Polyangiaceae bacterium]|nr:thioredoxin family protein [Polyangiaceae bacterium]